MSEDQLLDRVYRLIGLQMQHVTRGLRPEDLREFSARNKRIRSLLARLRGSDFQVYYAVAARKGPC